VRCDSNAFAISSASFRGVGGFGLPAARCCSPAARGLSPRIVELFEPFGGRGLLPRGVLDRLAPG